MSAPTTQQLLDEVSNAILALVTGGASSYSIQGRSVTRLDLKSLLEAQEVLMRRLERENGVGIFTLAKMNRTSG